MYFWKITDSDVTTLFILLQVGGEESQVPSLLPLLVEDPQSP